MHWTFGSGARLGRSANSRGLQLLAVPLPKRPKLATPQTCKSDPSFATLGPPEFEGFEHILLDLSPLNDESADLSLAQKLKNKIKGMIKIRRGLTVDSGAADHVMPIGWLILTVLASIGSKMGLHYVAADGTRIPNVGQQLVKFMTIDGTWTELVFQLAAINKPLVSVSKLIEQGYRVVFDERGSYIVHKKTQKIIWMRKERGVFVVDAYIAKNPDQGFRRQR